MARPKNGSKMLSVRFTLLAIDPVSKKGMLFVRYVRAWADTVEKAWVEINEVIATICTVEKATECSRLVVSNEFEAKKNG